ncbi:Fe(3+)-citrate import system permease protein YfmE [Pullulanibacillus camelliae]|uniref:Fe(3+)-citrate import system permease protein YfmE n=1 Tax=Pullulanibacillus camelliae TaxID=1707096 RepID=A0A8J2YPH3_9BACL|nr:iron ABC transporter permease [Pullulanibacillus camelliae]GGE56494.1 Fe(3+)-citrate import system permease protein YfmE [Pullulanibacillus camelliae]
MRDETKVLLTIERDRQTRTMHALLIIALLCLITAFFAILNLGLGTVHYSPLEIIRSFFRGGNVDTYVIVMDYRFPRIALALLVGAALATSGVIAQSVLRNPLASPSTLGISGGSGLAALITSMFFSSMGPFIISLSAFAGGGLVALAIYLFAYEKGVAPIRLAIVGVAIGAFCSAGIQLLVAKSGDNVSIALMWLSGSLWGRTWEQVWQITPIILVILPIAWLLAIRLNIMRLGDSVATALGLRVEVTRFLLLTCSVLLASAAVSAVGLIGFVGLVAPHMAKKIMGSRHQFILPTAALLGALLVLVSDYLGRALIPPIEIPAGLITAAIGAPYFLYLMWRESRKGSSI